MTAVRRSPGGSDISSWIPWGCSWWLWSRRHRRMTGTAASEVLGQMTAVAPVHLERLWGDQKYPQQLPGRLAEEDQGDVLGRCRSATCWVGGIREVGLALGGRA